MLKVYKECCGNCLLSKDAIVGPKRVKQIINKCIEEQIYFICHKSSLEGGSTICRKFYDQFGQHSQQIRIAERLGLLQFVDQENKEKLKPHREQTK